MNVKPKEPKAEPKDNSGVIKFLFAGLLAAGGVYLESQKEAEESKAITDIRKWSTAASGWEKRACLTKTKLLKALMDKKKEIKPKEENAEDATAKPDTVSKLEETGKAE